MTTATTDTKLLEESLGADEIVPRCTLLTLDPLSGIVAALTGRSTVECGCRARWRVLFECSITEHPHPHIELACDQHYEIVKDSKPEGRILWIRIEAL